jgi:hypothetical protein
LAHRRLREIAGGLDRTTLPSEQWVSLDRSLHRLERALADGQADLLGDDLAVRSVMQREEREENVMPDEITQSDANVTTSDGAFPAPAGTRSAPDERDDEPTTKLLREALDETRELVRLEIALAREETKGELRQAKAGAMALGSAAAAAVASFTMFMVAIALAFSVAWLTSLIIGVILLASAGGLAFAGYKALPTKPLAETKERLESDLKQLKERIA